MLRGPMAAALPKTHDRFPSDDQIHSLPQMPGQ